MVTTGFRNIYVATYSNTGQKVTYTGLAKLARARSFTLSVDASDDNNYYADDALAETESGANFTSGTLELTVDGLSGEEEALLFGLPDEQTVQVNESPIPVLNYGDGMNPPFVGVAGIVRKQLNGVVSYRPIVLPKCQFVLSDDSANTAEESIEWQDQTLNANVMRDDTANRNWKIMPKDPCTTLQAAIDFITAVLGGAAAAAASTMSEEPPEEPAAVSTETPVAVE